jgi:hypothetical protein
VAALAGPDGRGQPLLFDASFLLPSAVYAETDGRLLVGRDAERSARLDPTRFEPNPKRRIDDGEVLLGTREYQVADLVAAVLRRAGDEAARVAGSMPSSTVLTYPANWAASRKSALAEAASRAGMPSVTLVPEPIAAALYFTGVLGRVVAPGAALVVYDFGGGTFDTSVLRRRPDGGWDVLASDGLADVGGVDLDDAIIEHLHGTIGAADPDRWRQLTAAQDDASRRRYRLLWEEVRAAKEQLSRSSSASIHVPLFDTDVYLTREEFERIARPYLERTADLTAMTLQRAGMRPDQVGGLFPVGGSSRIPLASTLLHHRLGVAPTLIDQPELVVALGSLLAIIGPGGPRAPGFAPPPQTPASGFTPPVPVWPNANAPVSPAVGAISPLHGPSTPVSAPPVGSPVSAVPTPPVPSAPMSPAPVAGLVAAAASPAPAPVTPASGPPVSGPPTSGPPDPMATVAFQEPGAPNPPLWPPPGGPGGPPSFGPPVGVPKKRRGTLLAVTAAVVVFLILAGVGATQVFRKTSANSRARTGQNAANTNRNAGNNPGGAATSGGSTKQNSGTSTAKASVNKTAWYGQYKMTFGDVTYGPDPNNRSKQVSVAVVMENLGFKDEHPNFEIVFSSGDQHTPGQLRDSTLLAAGQRTNVTIDFAVDNLAGGLGSGYFTIGRGDEAKAVVPIGSTPELVAYEPRIALENTPVVHRNLNLKFKVCDIGGGFLDWHGQANKDHLVFGCKLDVQLIKSPGVSNMYFGEPNFRLKLPDGTVVGPTVAPNEALYSTEVIPDRYLAFSIPAPAKGSYALQVVEVLAGENATAPGTVKEVPVTL